MTAFATKIKLRFRSTLAGEYNWLVCQAVTYWAVALHPPCQQPTRTPLFHLIYT
jgi:hypothetical protein